ncbi:Uncharacterised protein [Mycobacteroides abscessus subsp. abscessus]|nr:Uncharacterised protein [Mycobacteroides abscessus subsp. abscessus]
MNAGRPPPPVAPRRGGLDGPHVLEFLCGPFGFALGLQLGGNRKTQFQQHLDVERRVVQPVRGQRALGPVGSAVPLLQAEAQQPLHHGRQVHPVVSGQPAAQFGVVQGRRLHTQFGKARQILVGRMQNPLVGVHDLGHRRQRFQRVDAVADGVDQHRAGTCAPNLDQVGPVGVAEARRPLGVDREGTVSGCQKLSGTGDVARVDGNGRHAVGGCQQGSDVGIVIRRLDRISVSHAVTRACANPDRSRPQGAVRRRARAPRRTPAHAVPAPVTSRSRTPAAPAGGRAAVRRCRRSAPRSSR